MFSIPEWALKSTPAAELDALLEWRLSAADVARLTGVTTQAVTKWATRGRRGWVLASKRFGEGQSARAFRLHDLRSFAEKADVFVDLTKLHPTLAQQWGIDQLTGEDKP